MAASSALVFYVSGHGFGHAARCIEVINAILARRPETRIGVRTAAPRWLFDLTIKGKITFSTLETDTGVVQIDALTLDEADSIRRASSFHSDLVTRAASETRVLRELGAGIIVGDIPPLAFAVGASAGSLRVLHTCSRVCVAWRAMNGMSRTFEKLSKPPHIGRRSAIDAFAYAVRMAGRSEGASRTRG